MKAGGGGGAVSGGWTCGWGWCWGMGMPFGYRVGAGVLGRGEGVPPPPFQAMPCPRVHIPCPPIPHRQGHTSTDGRHPHGLWFGGTTPRRSGTVCHPRQLQSTLRPRGPKTSILTHERTHEFCVLLRAQNEALTKERDQLKQRLQVAEAQAKSLATTLSTSYAASQGR